MIDYTPYVLDGMMGTMKILIWFLLVMAPYQVFINITRAGSRAALDGEHID